MKYCLLYDPSFQNIIQSHFLLYSATMGTIVRENAAVSLFYK